MKIFIGVTQERPTDEDLIAFPFSDNYPTYIFQPIKSSLPNEYLAHRVRDQDELEKVADELYAVWTIKEV